MNGCRSLIAAGFVLLLASPGFGQDFAPTDLTCELDAAGNVLMTWVDNDAYQTINISVDGTLHDSIAGSDDSYTVTGLGPGVHTLCVEAVDFAGLVYSWICCSIDLAGGGVEPPADLICDPAGSGMVALSWVNPTAYSEIRVLIDGVLVEVLPGTTTFHLLPVPPGSHTICLRGIAAAGPTPLVCCDVFLDMPDPITDLVCDPCGPGRVCLGWLNGGVYTSILVTVDGTPYATLPGTTSFFEVSGLAPGGHTICVIGFAGAASFDPVCCDIVVEAVYGEPSDLVCEPCPAAQVCLSWTGNGTYTQVRVTVDGLLYEVLPGSATSTTISGLAPGGHIICIIAEVLDAVLAPVCCDVEIDGGVIGEAPVDLVCELVGAGPDVAVSWTIMDTYSSIEVLVDGAVVATLPGGASAYLVTGLAPGAHEICVRAYKLGSLLLPVICCDVFLPDPATTSPSDLACDVLGLGPDVALAWTNNGAYSIIDVLVDGIVVDTLPGATTFYTVLGLAPGSHTICIRAFDLAGVDLGLLCCEVIIGATPPLGLTCDPIAGTSDVQLVWPSGTGYDNFVVKVDGTPVATLGAAATSYLVTVGPGSHTICVCGLIAGAVIVEDCCEITIGGPILELGCDPIAGTGDVALGWSISGPVSSFRVKVDGVVVDILPGTATFYTLSGLTPGSHTVCVCAVVGGVVVAEDCCDLEFGGPVLELGCDPIAGTGDVALGWSISGPVSSFRIKVDGVVVDTLPGTATFYTLSGLTPGSHTVCVCAVVGGVVVAEDCCDLEFGGPVLELGCDPIAGTGDVALGWSISGPVSSFRIKVDGVVVDILPGTATFYTLSGLTPGSHTVCVCAVVGGVVVAEDCCDLEFVGPVLELGCDPIAGTGDVALGWSISGPVSSFRIKVDGVVVDTLPGTATFYTLSGLTPGSHTVCVCAVVGGVVVAEDCCEVEFGPTAIVDLGCDAIAGAPGITVVWSLLGVVDGFFVKVDGTTVAMLPGSATFYALTGLASGSHTICVCGVIGGVTVTEACCEVTIGTGGPNFRRGDCNTDGSYDVADAIATLGFLFGGAGGGFSPTCDDACDANDDGGLNVADAVYSLSALFSGGPPPPAPTLCGPDPTADGLGCVSYPPCP